tara:strand:+ start:12415 stop:12894 length:480 start_codon:yes stop_codon:yes gene_type:complete
MVSESTELMYKVDDRLYYEERFDSHGLYWKHNDRKAGWRDEDGRVHIRLGKVLYLEHRLIYLLVHCYLPELIDHKDRDPSNNRPDNLRSADKRVNAINTGIPSNNTSGIKGVSWHKAGAKWTAQIKDKGRKIHLGSYSLLEEAVEARLKAEEELWRDIR